MKHLLTCFCAVLFLTSAAFAALPNFIVINIDDMGALERPRGADYAKEAR